MQTTYRLNANELDDRLIAALKATYQDKEIEIIVYEVDETEYLLKSEANKQRLLQAKANVDSNNNLVEVNLEDIE